MTAAVTLTFDDEFNTLNLWNGSSGTWDTTAPYVTWNGNGYSLPGNGEQEWYINANYGPTASVHPWTVNNGVLTLAATPASWSGVSSLINGYQYTSGAINTSQSFSQTYGYFEMRAQLPAGQGLWPAFWLLPENNAWPPEIDAMEQLGSNPGIYYTSVHSGTSANEIDAGQPNTVANTSAGMHTYGVDWEPDHITYYFDGQAIYQTATPSDMNSPMYMIANLAVGGTWPGNADGSTPFPADMNIDWMRAYSSVPSWVADGSDPTDVNHAAASGGNAGVATSPVGASAGSTGNTSVPSGDSASWYTVPSGVTSIVLTGGTAQTVIANNLGDTITSNDHGSTLIGGAGNDTLIAGHGADTMTGGGGSDAFVFNTAPWQAGHITDFDPAADKLDLTGVLHAIGYSGTNPVADGSLMFVADGGGDTQVFVNAHNWSNPWPTLITTLDHVSPDSIAASLDGSGDIVVTGTGGASTSGAAWSSSTGSAASGSSTVYTADGWYQAPSGVTNVTLTGTSPQIAIANNLGDTITANNAGSTITGGSGNDTLIAGQGADQLMGGTGSDTFVFNNLPWNAGHITDFNTGQDVLNLTGLFKAIGYAGSNPVADGYLSFASDGAGNTKVVVDAHNWANPWPTVVTTLDHVSPWNISSSDYIFHA